MVRVGTSGFHYEDWIGPFYPENLPKSQWLEYYAQEFDTCELNYTFYRMPEASQLQRMAERVQDGFRFALKAFRGITHEQENGEALLTQLGEAVKPLQAEGKLGAILFQFPYSFQPDQQNVAVLERCRGFLPDLPLVVEFRNQRWAREEAFDFLRQFNLGFCCVDEPPLRGLMPPLAVATADVAYVRFHGRNAEKWWNHEEAWERYDYSYSVDELEEWVPKIRGLSEEAEYVYAYANNHWQGQAVETARQLRLMLEDATTV